MVGECIARRLCQCERKTVSRQMCFIKMSDPKSEQRFYIKLSVKNNKSATETYQLLHQTFGDDCMSRSRVFDWHRRFSRGRESVRDDDRSGRPRTSYTVNNIQKVKNALQENPRLSIRALAVLINIDRECVRRIIIDENITEKIGGHRQDDFVVSTEAFDAKKRSPSVEDVNPKPSKSSKEEAISDENSKRELEFEAFAKSIVLQLCSMPYEDALKLQLKIQTLVTEERLKSLEKCQEESKENGGERDSLDLSCVKTEATDDDEADVRNIEHCNVPVTYSIIKPELIIKEEN